MLAGFARVVVLASIRVKDMAMLIGNCMAAARAAASKHAALID